MEMNIQHIPFLVFTVQRNNVLVNFIAL